MRSEEETLAGAPLWRRMLTFLSRSAREIALGEVLPGGRAAATLSVGTSSPLTLPGPSPRLKGPY